MRVLIKKPRKIPTCPAWDIAKPQNLIQAWGKNASYHFVFTRQNRGKLDELKALVERGQLLPHIGAVYSLADISSAHALLETPNNGLRGKVAIAVEPSLIP
ncbi:NADPH:quinone oxidoreductase (fragment) [Pseudomonas sp. 8O]